MFPSIYTAIFQEVLKPFELLQSVLPICHQKYGNLKRKTKYFFLFCLYLSMIQDLNPVTSSKLRYTVLKCPLFLRLQSQLLRATHLKPLWQKRMGRLKSIFSPHVRVTDASDTSQGQNHPKSTNLHLLLSVAHSFSSMQTPNKEHLARARWPSIMAHKQHLSPSRRLSVSSA